MEDKTKHVIAHAIYTICKILARELRFVLKPLGIGIIIFNYRWKEETNHTKWYKTIFSVLKIK